MDVFPFAAEFWRKHNTSGERCHRSNEITVKVDENAAFQGQQRGPPGQRRGAVRGRVPVWAAPWTEAGCPGATASGFSPAEQQSVWLPCPVRGRQERRDGRRSPAAPASRAHVTGKERGSVCALNTQRGFKKRKRKKNCLNSFSQVSKKKKVPKLVVKDKDERKRLPQQQCVFIYVEQGPTEGIPF